VREFRLCRQEDEPAFKHAAAAEGVERGMADDLGLIEVVEPGPAKSGIAEEEATRLNDIDRNIEAGRQPDERGCVLRDVGLEQGDTHSYVQAQGSNAIVQPGRFALRPER
jgi:hypothetical protein